MPTSLCLCGQGFLGFARYDAIALNWHAARLHKINSDMRPYLHILCLSMKDYLLKKGRETLTDRSCVISIETEMTQHDESEFL